MTINIDKKLHHRKPYLFIDEVLEHNTHSLKANKTFTENDFFIAGHFPGAPIIPGAIMQEMTTQAAGLLITEHYSPVSNYDSHSTKGYALGVLRAIHQAKYINFAKPFQLLVIEVELIQNIENSFRFKGKISFQDQKIMSNEFTLINISDAKLYS